MSADLQATLMQLFEQVQRHPDTLPAVSLDEWPEDSDQHRLLRSFHTMLERLQQHQQDQLDRLGRFALVVQTVNDGLWVWHLPTNAAFFSSQWKHLLGYQDHEIADTIGEWHLRLHPDDVERVLEVSRTALEGKTDTYEIEYRLRHKDGTYHWVFDRAKILRDGQGQTKRLVGSMTDITGHKLAEDRLHEKETQHRLLFEATSDGLLIVDLENRRVIGVNPRGCELLGYTREEFLGRIMGLSDDSQQPPVHAYDVVRAGGRFQVREKMSGKDGTSFPAEVRSLPYPYRGKPHMLVILRELPEQSQVEQGPVVLSTTQEKPEPPERAGDLTEQTYAEAQEREHETHYRSLFEAVSDGLLIVELEECRIVEMNTRACELYGYTREEALGRAYILYDDRQDPPIYAREVVKAGGLFQKQDRGVVNRGRAFAAEMRASPFLYRGEPHMLVVVRDTIEHVQAEEQLHEREAQYRSIFEATKDAMLILDPEDGHVVEANPAAGQLYGYTYQELIGVNPSRLFHPDLLTLVAEAIQTVRKGGQLDIPGMGRRKDEATFPVEGQLSSFLYKGKLHALAVIRDITERVEAERQLREREALYRSIFETTYDALAILDLEGHYVDVNPAVCQMFGYTREELIGQRASARTAPASQHFTTQALELLQAGGPYAHPTEAPPSLGVRKDGSVFPFEAHGSPITYRGQSHALIVGRDITEQVQAQHLLEQRVEERTRELASLLSISQAVASTLHLQPLVGLILDQLHTVVAYTGATILTVEDEELVVLDARTVFPEAVQRHLRTPLTILGPLWEKLSARESILLPDVDAETPLAQAFRDTIGALGEAASAAIHAALLVPLTLKEQVSGLLLLTAIEPGVFIAHRATLAQAVANQAAVAIANAQLYEQAQALAALEERQKLARELHDSVSQALYGISLGAHAARKALEQDPAQVAEPLDYVLSLAEAGLAEMRALIFELRPESLEQEGLVAALTKQGNALQARHELRVHLDLCDEPELPLPVKQELYRIAQEAMHNTVKHARARQVDLRLSQMSDAVLLEVRDDGVGFDPSGSFPGHLGLHSMRERVASLGGTLQIESTKGAGTRLCVQVPLPPRT